MGESSDAGHVNRLVTFLGVGDYREVIYQYGDRKAPRTRYVCRALADACLLCPSDIVVLATKEAEQRHGKELREALRAGNCPAPRLIRIPAGQLPKEFWQVFEAMKTELRDSEGPVMLDITHGFRSQPFFAAAVATFVHAVDLNPPDLRVCYGAYEAKNPETDTAPIWDLTEFVTLLDWSQALAIFLKTGRAEDAGKATERLGRELKKTWFQGGKQGLEPNLKELGEALVQFGADLEALRTGDLLIGRGSAKSSARRLVAAAKTAQEHAAQHAAPLADVLDRITVMAQSLVITHGDLSGAEGRNATMALAELYLRLGRYLEATATVREGWVNLYAPKTALVPAANAFDQKERERAERRAYEHDPAYREVTDRRNDFVHAQYRSRAQDATGVVQTAKRLVEKFKAAKMMPATQASRGVCLVNLSNHPSADWSEAQTKAALALAERIEDVAFPSVPPDADENAIEALAEACVARIPGETTHALVQGEFTLTVELVRRLQARRITCLAATSTRNVREEADGRRVSEFTFVRFRAYPEPRPMP